MGRSVIAFHWSEQTNGNYGSSFSDGAAATCGRFFFSLHSLSLKLCTRLIWERRVFLMSRGLFCYVFLFQPFRSRIFVLYFFNWLIIPFPFPVSVASFLIHFMVFWCRFRLALLLNDFPQSSHSSVFRCKDFDDKTDLEQS